MSTHTCPGCGCSDVPLDRLACRACWYRLPGDMRLRIWAAGVKGFWTVAHLEALADGWEWLDRHRSVAV